MPVVRNEAVPNSAFTMVQPRAGFRLQNVKINRPGLTTVDALLHESTQFLDGVP